MRHFKSRHFPAAGSGVRQSCMVLASEEHEFLARTIRRITNLVTRNPARRRSDSISLRERNRSVDADVISTLRRRSGTHGGTS